MIKKIEYHPIGIIHTPFTTPEDAPNQPTAGVGIDGTVELLPEFEDGLCELSRFSHIYLIYHLHLVTDCSLKVRPHSSTKLRGVFATRSPKRPNSIGISVVRLRKIEGIILNITDLDMVDGTPLIDVKPYIPFLAKRHGANMGWLTDRLDEE